MKVLHALFWMACLTLSCQKTKSSEPVEVTRFLMDTIVRIAVYDESLPPDRVNQVIDKAFTAMEHVERNCSSHIGESEIFQINTHAGQNFIEISKESALLLETAIDVGLRTDGAFDVTVGVIKRLWGFTTDNPVVPSESDLEKYLSLVDFNQIVLENDRARLIKAGMNIDLGGIAKGLTIDEAVRVLQESGIRSGLVDAGGDMRIFGQHPDNPRWRIGIRHPRPTQNSMVGVLETRARSIATSGDYERFFERDGIRYHHILDPETGAPSNRCVSVTVVAESAMMADAYATAVFVMGPERGMAFIESLPDVEGLILFEKEGRLNRLISGGLKADIRFLD